MEPWEALDLDYSDVQSLLRPLKRHRSPQHLSASTTPDCISSQSLPILKPCSRPSTQCPSQYENRRSDSNSSPQNPICQSQRISTPLEPPCSSAASTRLIPGPAGAVQAAMQRRTRGDNCFYVCDDEPVPTQEYIRRVIENGDEQDDDFNGNPWRCALDFVRGLGAREGNGAMLETPLSSIKNGFSAEKIALVVAIIKSYTSNGLGDMMVTLKDPTGTIDASIHHGVISEGNYGKGLSVGAVLILQKIAVFSPTRFVHVLNVTSSNVVKVISKDSGPPIIRGQPTSPIKQRDSVTGESYGEAHMLEKGFAVPPEGTENIMNNLRQISKMRGSGRSDPQTIRSNAALYSNCKGNENERNQQTVFEKSGRMMDPNMSNGISRLGSSTFPTYVDQETVVDEHTNHYIGADTETLPERAQENGAKSNLTQVSDNQEVEKTDGVEKIQTQTARPLLPQWTDEQLDELFAFD